MSRSKVSFCGRLRTIDKYEGETVANVLAIDFRSDTTNAYTGFEIAFTEKQGRLKLNNITCVCVYVCVCVS